MMKKLLYTNDQPVGLILRLTLGIVLLPHGLQQLLGCFGGNGFSGTSPPGLNHACRVRFDHGCRKRQEG